MAFYFGLRNQNLGGHSRNKIFLAVINLQLKCDGLDVPLAAVHIALRGEISLWSLENNLAGDNVTGRQPDFELIAQGNVYGFGFRNGGANPGVA